MGSGGTEFDAADSYSAARLNQKTIFVGTGTQIAALATTYAGQLAYATSTTGGFTIDRLYERNAANTAFVSVDFGAESTESNTTPVTDGADFTAVAGTRYYAFFTLPSTHIFFIITGLEWKNGATVSGNVIAGVDIIDADPPTLASVPLVALANEIAQAGTSVIQRNSQLTSKPIRGGSVIGAWVSCSSGTATLREQTGLGSQNQSKATAYSTGPPTNDVTAWTATTARKYLKIYYRGYT